MQTDEPVSVEAIKERQTPCPEHDRFNSDWPKCPRCREWHVRYSKSPADIAFLLAEVERLQSIMNDCRMCRLNGDES